MEALIAFGFLFVFAMGGLFVTMWPRKRKPYVEDEHATMHLRSKRT